MSDGLVTIGALKRLSSYIAGQLKTAVAFTGGTIDGVTIGGTTPAAATVTTLTANTSVTSASYRNSLVVTETTAANLANSGQSLVASTGGVSAFTMSAPVKGVEKMIRCTASTAASNVTVQTGVQIADNATQTVLNFGGKCSVLMKAESSILWSIAGGWQSSLVTLSS